MGNSELKKLSLTPVKDGMVGVDGNTLLVHSIHILVAGRRGKVDIILDLTPVTTTLRRSLLLISYSLENKETSPNCVRGNSGPNNWCPRDSKSL